METFMLVNLKFPHEVEYEANSFESLLETLETAFRAPKIIKNGERFKCLGYAFVKVDFGGVGDRCEYYFYHPKTNPSDNGDFDIVIRPKSKKGKFKRFSSRGEEVTIVGLETNFRHLWPTGAESFILIANAVDRFI
ncbi:MAG: hypothetical protein Q7R98_03375 [Candidatus Jorgensenbacteria bacterium]|nr:hypothetical protein [Candidatus Jorgensenbacteria bacterium]